MKKRMPRIATWHEGALHLLEADSSGREAVLALPLSRLLVRVVRVPIAEDPVAFATPILQAISPFPDEPLAVSCEVMRETGDFRLVLAAALPEGSADDIAEALDAASLQVVKVDLLPVGALRSLWSEILKPTDDGATHRTLLTLRVGAETSLIVLDGDEVLSFRALMPNADVKRERLLSLLEAENVNGPCGETVELEREVSLDDALRGIRERAEGEDSLNALPASWRQVLDETRMKRTWLRSLAIAGGVWLLAVATLFGVPFAYELRADHAKSLSRRHQAAYRAVSDKKAKTLLVRKYSDRLHGALEIMKAVSDRLEGGITLSGWDFSRLDGLRVKGESSEKNAIYKFKDKLAEMADEGGETVFAEVKLGSIHSQKDGTQRFDLECRYEKDE